MIDEHCALRSSNSRLVQDQLKRQSTLPGKTIAPALCFLVGQKRKSPHRLVLSGCLGVLVLLFLAAPALSADVTLAWDPNSEPDLEGYGVYFRKGTPGPPYDLAGNLALADLNNDDAPLFVVSGLEKGFKYYFAVTAYDTAGNESALFKCGLRRYRGYHNALRCGTPRRWLCFWRRRKWWRRRRGRMFY